MSTILDALRKLQRDRAAASPTRDLRGSITGETQALRARRSSAGLRGLSAAALVLVLGGGGYWLYQSGLLAPVVDPLVARFGGAAGEGQGEDVGASEAELAEAEAELERLMAERGGESGEVAAPPAASPPAGFDRPMLRERARQAQIGAGAPPPPESESPEALAEKRNYEEALEKARAAHAEQQRSEAAAAAAAAAPPAPAPDPPAPAMARPALRRPPTGQPAPVARTPGTAPAPATAAAPSAPSSASSSESVVEAKPKPAPAERAKSEDPGPTAAERREAAERAAAAREEPEPAPIDGAFPSVRVESIRWHPLPERRVASLHFERQDAPEAREGDIVAGVLVYRIDPGAVELRVGTASRIVRPTP